MNGLTKCNSGWKGVAPNPPGVPNPSCKATADSTSPFRYSCRYLDWDRTTFELHAVGNRPAVDFDSPGGLAISTEITQYRDQLKLGDTYGCVPQELLYLLRPLRKLWQHLHTALPSDGRGGHRPGPRRCCPLRHF